MLCGAAQHCDACGTAKQSKAVTGALQDAEEFEKAWLLLADLYVQQGKFDLAQATPPPRRCEHGLRGDCARARAPVPVRCPSAALDFGRNSASCA